MQPLILSVVLSLAVRGIYADQHRHAHARLHARADVTVLEVVTDTIYVTEYVGEDGVPVSATTLSTSITSLTTEPTTHLEAEFLQLPTSSSTSTSTSSTTSSTTSTSSSSTSTSTSISTSSSIETPIVTPPAATPTPSSSSSVVADPIVAGERTFTIINSHTAAISTAHDDTVGTPTSAGAAIQPGTMAAGATATFAAKAGWVGNIGINDAAFSISSASTLIEANFVEWFGIPKADFDISFVNGFTLPATCSCNGVVKTGCNIDLNALASCPGGTSENACANPLRSNEAAVSASSFFAPCEGAAWTFVNDGNADAQCDSGPIVCCIGTACPANPKQSKRKF